MEQTGVIFDVSHYMLEDGPGIRTNIFVKGCSLRCRWCSNAYGLSPHIQLGYAQEKCTGCGACYSVCPESAISWNKNHIAVQNFQKCKNCLKCVPVCMTKARFQIGITVSVKDVMSEIQKDWMYYRRSGGGATLSGGEILMQPEFVREILKQCTYAGIHTAIETSANGRWEDLSRILSYCDTAFIDCKCMDSERHRVLTGVSNAVILKNIQNAAKQCRYTGTELIIRLPLIPTLNDDAENLTHTAEFVASLEGHPLLNILPYHNYGESKYARIGKRYETGGLYPQSRDDLEVVQEILSKTGVRYSVGGYDIAYAK